MYELRGRKVKEERFWEVKGREWGLKMGMKQINGWIKVQKGWSNGWLRKKRFKGRERATSLMKEQKNKRLEPGKEEREKWIEKERMDRGQMKRRLLLRKT